MIDPRTKEWDKQIINNIFDPEDQELILKLPLGQESLPDSRCWHYTQSGIFLVKSAYTLVVEVLNTQSPSTWFDQSLNACWKSIWKDKLPLKVWLFAWKLASDALPTAPYRKANVSHSKQHDRHKTRPSEQSPPVVGTIKINFDGAVLEKGCEVGIRGMAQDSTGSVIAWFSCGFWRQVDGEIAEALAAKESVDLALKHG
ncbi:UNVERIFIED_CONTAM: hypothetical protein Slati_0976800 [Sesamum latifolium]|uniref:RNase H type-1 domain-containing protein n=1 Tax=Sesamum latifolium TaxID=2727402 RepID=A0AAW2XUE4_9LAMI